MGAAAPASVTESTTVTLGRSLTPSTDTDWTSPALAAGSAVTLAARTTTMPRVPANVEWVRSLPPNVLISTRGA